MPLLYHWLSVATLKKLLLSPICLLHKRKEVDLSLELVKERAKAFSAVNQARVGSEVLEVSDDESAMSMLLLSIVPSGSPSSSHFFYPKDLLFATFNLP